MHGRWSPAVMLVLALVRTLVWGATARAEVGPAGPVISLDDRVQAMITQLARQVIPYHFENTKHWGQTQEVVRGLYVKREGLRIKTHRTWQRVNHGTWTKYRVELVDPDTQFRVRVENIRGAAAQRVAFEIVCDARLRIFGRLSQWQHGVQLISLSAEADADVRLMLSCDVAVHADTGSTAPGFTIDPVVRAADLQMRSFQMRSISQLDGPLVKTLSASIRELIEDEVADRRARLVAQVNRQIDKKRSALRVSLADLLGVSGESFKGEPEEAAGHAGG